MYVADPFRPTAAGSTAPPVPTVPAPTVATPTVPAPTVPAPTVPAPTVPTPPVAVPAPSWPTPEWRVNQGHRESGRVRQDGLSARTGRLIAGAFAIAWILCPTVEPLPSGPVPDYPLWQLPIDLATVVSIVAAVIVLWRGGRLGALLGAVAGAFMLLETAMCPIAGHTPVGWWTWTQTVLSLLVLGASAVLLARQDTTF